MAKLPTKKLWQSKTIWAAVASLGVAVASWYLGDASPLVAALVTVFSAFGIYGRVTATSAVTLK